MAKNLHLYVNIMCSSDEPLLISACGGADPFAEERRVAAQDGGGQHQPNRLEDPEGHGPAIPAQKVPVRTR